MVFPVFLALALSLVHFLGEKFSHAEKYHQHFLSLASGMLIALLFLEIMPAIFSSAYSGVPVFMLLGFALYHLLEKHVYKHRKIKIITRELAQIHLAGFFLDGIAIGFVLVLASALSAGLIFILSMPLALGALGSSISVKHIHDRFRIRALHKALLSVSYVLGAMIAQSLDLRGEIFYSALSFLAGVILYFVVRDELPETRKSVPWLFVSGMLAVAALVLMGKA